MKKILIFAFVLMLATGCASGVQKSFTLIIEPSDAEITVTPGGGQPEQKYRSPANITVEMPEDPVAAAKGKVEIKRDSYKSMTILLKSIQAETMRLKLSKIQYRMKLRLIRPVPSDDLSYRDQVLAIRMIPDERHFNVKILNLAQKPIHILWDKSDYTDYLDRPHGIRPLDLKSERRDRPVARQEIPVGGSLEQTVFPVDMVTYSSEKKAYDSKPLFPLDNDSALGLKGKSFFLALPVEIDRAIIPDYIFQFEIVDVVKE